ncbi:MAG: MarR family transcriptional regulator [Thermoanaerobaculia bacterium]|nr:MarR family transcriptional regulator [Thermoanaerobaculia bacterium]
MSRRSSPLQREIGQSKPFATSRQEATLALLRTADVVRRRLSDFFEGHGLTTQQYNVLRILRGAGESGLPTLSIGERMLERTPGVTRLVDRLVEKGWVYRERSPNDRRQVFCFLSESGLELLSRLDEPVLRLDETSLGGLSCGDEEQLLRLLDRIRDPSTGKEPGS